MRPAVISNRLFYPVAVVGLVAGNAFDLIGTYLSQPQFQDEANPIHTILKQHGYSFGWPAVIMGKIVVCIIGSLGLYAFLCRRQSYYPSHAQSFREFITHVFYGRPLGWVESFYRVPAFAPTVFGFLAVCSLAGPYFAYLGYGNLAARYGWWHLGGLWAGRFWVDGGVFVWLPLAVGWFSWQLWQDYQHSRAHLMTEIVA